MTFCSMENMSLSEMRAEIGEAVQYAMERQAREMRARLEELNEEIIGVMEEKMLTREARAMFHGERIELLKLTETLCERLLEETRQKLGECQRTYYKLTGDCYVRPEKRRRVKEALEARRAEIRAEQAQ